MTPEQFSRLLDLLEQISTRSQAYTLTEASDWPIMMAMMGILGFMMTIVLAMVAFMWSDLRAGQKELKNDFGKDVDSLWKGLRDCQTDCCPPRNRGEK